MTSRSPPRAGERAELWRPGAELAGFPPGGPRITGSPASSVSLKSARVARGMWRERHEVRR